MPTYEFPAGATGHALIRFSGRRQADGDSFRRQDTAAASFCRQKSLPLDTSLYEADIRKLGISAFTGSDVVKGPLRKFLAGIEDGRVKRGDVLLVSEWNRLTRQVPLGHDEKNPGALDLVRTLFRAGIGIVDLQDGAYYTLHRYN